MDVKVYKKEEVQLPQGQDYVFVPDVIDLIPIIDSSSGTDIVTGAVELDDETKDLLEQECSLAIIWQRGLDPLDSESGIHWSEVLLGEINAVQIMEEITKAVAEVTNKITVVFDTVTDTNGNSFLTYTLQEVA